MQKAVAGVLEAGVKRGFLNPDYMRPAWRAELDQVRPDSQGLYRGTWGGAACAPDRHSSATVSSSLQRLATAALPLLSIAIGPPKGATMQHSFTACTAGPFDSMARCFVAARQASAGCAVSTPQLPATKHSLLLCSLCAHALPHLMPPQITEQQMTADEQLMGALSENAHAAPPFHGAFVAPLYPAATCK